MTFRDLGLSAPILRALEEQGYQSPSPIQAKAIPPALIGRDVLGCAQTGTGQTCAFAAPILQRLSGFRLGASARPIRALILTPTRELAIQIDESFAAYGKYLKLRHTVIFGGVGQTPQVEALGRGVDILVATPGRLMDLHDQGYVSLDHLEIFVLDEADRMLDMGFIHDVKKILKWLPAQKQTLFFSATMPPEITELVNSLLHNPAKVAVNPISSPVESIQQWVYPVDKGNKTKLLAYLIQTKGVKNALVFTRTKHGANKVARDLEKAGISAAAIHGNKSQTARQQALNDFKSGKLRCLVATDIAARGLDIEELSHVFNYNLPEVPETYVHRIGRTGRAGRGGEAIAFCDFAEQPLLKEIQRLIGRTIPVVEDHPYPMVVFQEPKRDKNGRVINEEDAEARSAAKELRRQREQSRQAAKEKKEAQPLQVEEQVEKAVAQEGEKPRKRSRRRKKGGQQAAVLSPVRETLEQEKTPVTRPERPKMTRSGKLMDTGDSMPRTDFQRPNPLDSDIVLDATARLLAPRTLTLTPAREQRREGQRPAKKTVPKPHSGSGEGRKARSPETKAQSQRPPKPPKPGKGDRRGGQNEERRRVAPSSKKRDQGGRRGAGSEPHSSKPKDSTEQPSLMKPYYLDIGR